MKVLVSRPEFLAAITAAAAITAKKADSNLSSLRVTASESNVVSIYATNNEQAISFDCKFVQVEAPGTFAVHPERLLSLLKAMASENVALQVTGNPFATMSGDTLVAQSTEGKYSFQLKDPSLIPCESSEFESLASAAVNARSFAKFAGKVLRGSWLEEAGEGGNFTLNGMTVQISGAGLKLVGSDARAMIVAHMPGTTDGSRSVILPAICVRNLIRLTESADVDDALKIEFGETRARFSLGSCVLYTALIQGRPIAFGDFIPAPSEPTATIVRDELTSALRRLNVFTEEDVRGAAFAFGPEGLEMKAGRLGDAISRIPCKVAGGGITIGFSIRRMLDVLVVDDEEEVRIELSTPSRPAVIRSECLTCMIMPVSLKPK